MLIEECNSIWSFCNLCDE